MTAYGTGRPLVIIAGQSNGTGHGYSISTFSDGALELPSQAAPFSFVPYNAQWSNNPTSPMVWTAIGGGSMAALQPYATLGSIDMGCELALGKTLYDMGYAPAIGKFCVDATSLEVHWHPMVNFPTSPSGHNLFGQFVDYIRQVQTATGSTLAAIVWIQGENDATDATQSAHYQLNLGVFFNALRAELGNTFAVVLNQLNANADIGVMPFRETVRAAQAAYVASDPNARMITVSDIALGGTRTDSSLHYDGNAQSIIGYRFARALAPLLAMPTKTPPAYVGGGTADWGTGTLAPRWDAPGGVLANDIGILAVSSGFGNVQVALAAAQGFQLIGTADSVFSGIHHRLTLYWCRATTTPVLFPTVAAGNNYQSARIYTFRGCVQVGTPFDVLNSAVNNDNNATFLLGDGTTVVAESLAAMFAAAHVGALPVTWADPSSPDFKKRNLVVSSGAGYVGDGGGNDPALLLVTGEKRWPGYFFPVSVTGSGSDARAISAAITIALRPV